MTTTFHRHWRDVPESAWRWPNFSPAEIACRGTGKLLNNEPALDKLQALRDRLGKPLIVRSAYRSPEHNRAVGGATRSKHLDGAAFDIAMANHDPVAFEAAAREVGFRGFLDPIPEVLVYVALTAWVLGMVGLLRRIRAGLRRPRAPL
ncbi:D-Ala-D-Ala carboxypeptidase family metallohydrolase [Paracoccus sp. 2205BS29-5]|uniref:D-Ala-D-Ala carboxypeptidase family metallohydrolase n=1 Tax=Paracoccus spongiarum TaxID=3064387 RepID=A0ABT9J8U9_9RHOB|nr:D-Ala-D-Ala carboxypeptidase family metallohydrolase [Paracoccus sp. 2205BS29-5]MDP5306235.1 D-Ala-D-Ala carboxypeptidase family metallohydrolase [Paracoccus sp. 2205BS29-5]